MKRLILIFLICICSCKNQEQILLQKNIMSTEPIISFVDEKRGFVSVRWECENPPYINQPCFKFLEFPISSFQSPKVGRKLKLQ